MAVSVIISNFNGDKFLPRLLETLEAQQGVEFEIIVVDRLSSDRSAEILSQHKSVRVVSEPPLSGLVAGYQRGSREALHDLLFFCNEDMWFEPDCLRNLVKAIEKPGVWAADPWQWTYDGKELIHAGMEFSGGRFDINSPFPFRTANYTKEIPEGSFVSVGCAGAIMVRRTMFEELEGWDTSFFLDNEDTDLFLRAWQRGWRCATVPSSKVYHAVGMSNTKVVAPKQTVSERRYVGARSNKAVIGFKYYSPIYLWAPIILWMLMAANNLCKARFKLLGYDLKAAALTWRRLPAVRAFRRKNRQWNRIKPGQLFFFEQAVIHPKP